jgi:hypothetical protein
MYDNDIAGQEVLIQSCCETWLRKTGMFIYRRDTCTPSGRDDRVLTVYENFSSWHVGSRCDAKFLTCEIPDYCRTAHAQTMRMNDFGS